MLKVGLVGSGGISRAHIPAWLNMAETELVALCDIRPEQMEEFPQCRHYTDFEEMLHCEKLDILDICLPTYLHVDYAVKAMEQGIHVICEKPIAFREEDVHRAYEAAHRNGVCFMIAQVLRFWPEYELLKDIYDSKRYGKLLAGSMQRLGVRPLWSWDNWMMDKDRSGMVPFDLHIHDLTLWCMPLVPLPTWCSTGVSGLTRTTSQTFTSIPISLSVRKPPGMPLPCPSVRDSDSSLRMH